MAGKPGRSGRPRKPTQVKILQGTFSRHRVKKGEPKPRLVNRVPSPPTYLNIYAKRLWRELAPELLEQKLLTILDLPTLELCCEAYGLYREALAAMLNNGKRSLKQYLDGQSSQTIPEAIMMRQCWATYKSFMTEFGLSPSSRARLDVAEPKKPEQDPMEQILHEV